MERTNMYYSEQNTACEILSLGAEKKIMENSYLLHLNEIINIIKVQNVNF